MFNSVKYALAALALSAVAAQAATPVTELYRSPGTSLKTFGPPAIVEGRLIPTTKAQVVFTQSIDFTRIGTLSRDLDLITPDPDHHLSAGTELYASETETGTRWCTIHLTGRDTICLYAQDGGWIWQQNDKRLPARCYFVLPCLLGPPKIDPILYLPVTPPQFDESTPIAPRFTQQVTLRKSGDTWIDITTDCKAAKADIDDRILRGLCRYPDSARPGLFIDRIFVGGDNIGARLHYDAGDGSIVVSKVVLDPATGKIAP